MKEWEMKQCILKETILMVSQILSNIKKAKKVL